MTSRSHTPAGKAAAGELAEAATPGTAMPPTGAPRNTLPDGTRAAAPGRGFSAADGAGKGLAYLLLAQEVHEFLCAEADLLDERRYEEWLELLTDDICYWAPMRRNVQFGHWDTENTRQGRDMNWFDEGKSTLRLRIKQITSGVHWVEEPAPRVSRLITNVHGIQAAPSLEDPEEVRVKYRILIYRNKLEDSTDVFAGKRDDVLRKVNGAWKIRKRTMLLDQSVLLSATMPFVL